MRDFNHMNRVRVIASVMNSNQIHVNPPIQTVPSEEHPHPYLRKSKWEHSPAEYFSVLSESRIFSNTMLCNPYFIFKVD